MLRCPKVFVNILSLYYLNTIKMRIIAIPILALLWLIHMLYRGFIKKDLRQSPDEFYIGAGFILVWVAAYWFIFA